MIRRNEWEQPTCPDLLTVLAAIIVLVLLAAADNYLAYWDLATCATDDECEQACYRMNGAECQDMMHGAERTTAL